MLNPETFLVSLQNAGVSFFAGVPDSLLKDLCACIDETLPKEAHMITANEGGAVATAAGHYLATGQVPVVYLQNSGLGNTVNPLLSLTDPAVYGIPMLLIIGWRGEPGTEDEPQHKKQGPVTAPLLGCLEIPHAVLPDDQTESDAVITDALSYCQDQSAPYALLVRKGTFEQYGGEKPTVDESLITREAVLETVLNTLPAETVFIGTTGKLSRELFELREKRNEGHERDFLTVGSMGHASQIALGIAEAKPERLVVCLDGDGAALMHLGGLTTIGARAPQNYLHLIFNNGVHESVGGQAVTGENVNFAQLAREFGYQETTRVEDESALTEALENYSAAPGPNLIECQIRPGSREDLGRPTTTPAENKTAFQKFLRTK